MIYIIYDDDPKPLILGVNYFFKPGTTFDYRQIIGTPFPATESERCDWDGWCEESRFCECADRYDHGEEL